MCLSLTRADAALVVRPGKLFARDTHGANRTMFDTGLVVS